MRARAPGKLVLSGAYAVLEGAPAIVSAVDRYVLADASREADFVPPEVRAAIGDGPAPWFDASELRDGDRKLGLGSSAAILVASLGALELQRNTYSGDQELASAVFSPALSAHRMAQGGGSGVDVAASCHGGTLLFSISGDTPRVEHVSLPAELEFRVWSARRPASTAKLVAKVQALRSKDPAGYSAAINQQARASEAAAGALTRGACDALLEALRTQHAALAELGVRAGVPIVIPEVAELHELAARSGGVVLPAGAGGGDVCYYVGCGSLESSVARRSLELGLDPVPLTLAARGLHPSPTEST